MIEITDRTPINIEEEMKRSYLDYAMSVIIGRALPDVRDGLKPVHRRILWAMHEIGLQPNRPYKKSAAVVGDVLGKYHPHGDASVYDAMVRLVQEFSMREPLVDGQGNFGCFTGDTRIKLLDGTERTFAELAELPANEVFFVYSIDQNGRVVVGEGRHSRITRRDAQLVELTFDDGTTVRCTPDHRFMLRDGAWREAKDLTIDDSLMAGYFDTAPVTPRSNDYLRVLQPRTGAYEFVHWIADVYNEERGIAPARSGSYVRHHKNGDRFDNRPSNIERMNWLEHFHLHASRIRDLWATEEFRAAQRAGVRAYYANNPEALESRRQRMMTQNRSEAFRTANGLRVARSLTARHANHPELAQQQGALLRRLWQDPDYREKMSRALRGIAKRPLTPAQKERVSRIISQKSRAMWSDARKRESIVAAIVEALSDASVRTRMSENSRRLWRYPAYRAKYAPDHHSRMARQLWSNPAMKEFHREKMLQQWQDPGFREAHLEGRRRDYARRSAESGAPMAELTLQAAASLREKWNDAEYANQVMQTKIAGYVSRLIAEVGRDEVSPEIYETRRNANWIPKCDKAVAYFGGFDEMVAIAATHNHRVVRMTWIEERADVYDITVDVHHNFMLANGCVVHNSVDGDAAAAYRYTEARLTRIATEMMADIDKDTVDFTANFDESRSEPVVLPTRFPNLLVNGSGGIAVGMATNIPPHNLHEIVEATILLVENPEATTEELIKIVPGPDFPTGGFIYGRRGIRDAYETGRGSLMLRARAAIDRVGKSHDKEAIVITEIPFQVNKARLLEQIAELVNEKRIEGVADLRDESDRDGMRIVIELKRDAIAQVVMNKLYKLTPMQTSFGVINLAIVNGQPQVLPLGDTLRLFVEHRREVVTRRTKFELAKAEARAHILEGLKKALDNLDAVITLIRKSKNAEEARGGLMTRFDFSERQAKAILEMQLQRLTGLERQKLIDEYTELIKLIAELNEILASDRKLRRVIVKELRDVQKDFGSPRRTEIVDETAEFRLEDLIVDEDVAITVTHNGYIKRTPVSVFREQRRGGMGRRGAALKMEDLVEHIFVASTHSYLMIFSDKGRVYKVKVHELPDAEPGGRGKAIVNLIQLPRGEKVAGFIPVREFSEGRFVVMVSRKGVIKKTELSAFANIRAAGIIAMGVDDDDELIAVAVTDGTKKIFLATHEGMAIVFEETGVRDMGRQARGVRGISLGAGDYVVSAAVMRGDEQVLSIAEGGYGKRTDLIAYRFQSRGGKGVINMKTTDKTGKVVGAFPVTDESKVLVISERGKLIRIGCDSIRQTGRSAQGVKLIDAGVGDRVASVSLIERVEEDAPEQR